MANEIKVLGFVGFKGISGGPNRFTTPLLTFERDAGGDNVAHISQLFSTTEEDIAVSADMGIAALMLIVCTGAAGVELKQFGVPSSEFGTLKQGEFAIIPTGGRDIAAKALSGTCTLEIWMFQ